VGAGPNKREGDGRAPAGVFRLTDAFGYSPADSIDTGLPYVRSTPDLECVDDVESGYYNRVVDRRRVSPDWDSHEEMRRADVLYRRGVVVGHNAAPAAPGGGSCIFLHVWRGPGSTTSGCTAMAEPALATAMAWLDEASDPVLVQLPAREFSRRRATWELPSLP
jgi:D-alanyl-D-alanine dipeptidase